MKALILAAGRGSRMKSLTDEKPKALVNVRGRPLLRSSIENLQEAGIRDIGIVTGYRRELLAWPDFTREFHNSDWETTNMVQSLRTAHDWLEKSDCIVCYSDILFTAATIRSLAAAPGDLVVANNVGWATVWSKRFANPLDDAETFKRDATGALTEIGRKAKTLNEIQGQYMGLFKISPKGWARFESVVSALPNERFRKIDMTSTLDTILRSGFRIETVDIDEEWFEFDSEDDLTSFSPSNS